MVGEGLWRPGNKNASVAWNPSLVWQPGYQAGYRVLSVGQVNITPSQFISQDNTMC